MPALLTHYLCGDRMVKSVNTTGVINVINSHRNLFNLGTQGPDVFFYHNAWPWAKGKSLSKVGSRLHHEKVKAFFDYALEAIEKKKGDVKERLQAYLYGYVCHYSLDIHTHPYIYYKTGFAMDEKEDKKKYDAYHRRFEAEIDVIMAEEILKKRTRSILSYKLIDINDEDAALLARMYRYILKNLFEMDIPEDDIKRAAKDMVSVTKALRDVTGIKKSLIGFVEKRANKHPLISNMIYPLKIDKKLDTLNTAYSPWYHPWDSDSVQHSSFHDLFHEAVEEAKTMCIAVNQYFNGNIEKSKLLDILGNRSFSSGVDCDEEEQFQYYDLIYK